jgi:DNA-directed RNA polymerase specialized sigma24 family protein
MGKSPKLPATPRSWTQDSVSAGDEGLALVNRHVMQVYYEPLAEFLEGTRHRTLGDPHELVASFLADRLARSDYFLEWARSGKRLRHWLWNGLVYSLREMQRRDRRDSTADLPPNLECDGESVERALDRAFARSVVRTAIEAARQRCAQKGFAEHFEVFHTHEWKGVRYAEIARDHDIDVQRARVMSRTGRDAFRAAIRRVLLRDGASHETLDDEIAKLLESLA